jgi:hypothetical protein
MHIKTGISHQGSDVKSELYDAVNLYIYIYIYIYIMLMYYIILSYMIMSYA